jgi:hypothetical protein
MTPVEMHHANVLTAIVGLLVVVVGALVTALVTIYWRGLTKISDKLDMWMREHLACRDDQAKRFIGRGEFELHLADYTLWKKSRVVLWRRLNKHAHDTEGRVVIIDE